MKIKRMLMSFAFLGLGLVSLASCGDKPNKVEVVKEDGTKETVTVEATKDSAKVAKALKAVSQKTPEKEFASAEVSVKANLAYGMSVEAQGAKVTMELSGKANATVKVAIDPENPENVSMSAKGSVDGNLSMNVKAGTQSQAMKVSVNADANAYVDAGLVYADYNVKTNGLSGINPSAKDVNESGKNKMTLEELMTTIGEEIGNIIPGDPSDVPSIDLPVEGDMTIEEAVEAYGITITGTSSDTITFGFVLDETDLGQDFDKDPSTNLELMTLSLTLNTVYMVPSSAKLNANNLLKYADLNMGDLGEGATAKITKSTFTAEYSMKFGATVDKLTDAQKAEYTEFQPQPQPQM